LTYQLLNVEDRPQFVLCGEVLKNDSLNVRNQRRNSTAHASLASKPQEFFERTLLSYDKNSVLLTDVNTCDIMRCGNCSQALQVIPIPKSANWIDIKLQQRTTSNSDYMSAQNLHLTNQRLNRPCRFMSAACVCQILL